MLSDDLLLRVQQHCHGAVVVAYSGGVDSTVLLHFVAQALSDRDILALHVNHQLHAAANEWQAHCSQVAAALGVRFESVTVNVDARGSVEQSAREARYQVFRDAVQATDWLLMAHHEDDQVETALFRLFRGDDVPGIRGMPQQRSLGRGTLYRPLLTTPRRTLLAYAREQGLRWIEDTSNQEVNFDRNYLRHKVIPVVKDRFRSMTRSIVGSIAADDEVREYLQNNVDTALNAARGRFGGLTIELWRAHPPFIQRLMLRRFLELNCVPQPSGRALEPFVARYDSKRVLHLGVADLRSHAGHLVLVRVLEPQTEAVAGDLAMQRSNRVAGGAILKIKAQKGDGLRRPSGELMWRLKQPGDRVRVHRMRSVKNLMQELLVPNWLKPRLPLILVDNEVAAIPAIPEWQVPQFVLPAFKAGKEEAGLLCTLKTGDCWPSMQAAEQSQLKP